MNTSRSRVRLLILWLAFFLLHLGVLFQLYFLKFIETEDLVSSIKAINTAYSPYLGSILMFYWGSNSEITTAQQSTIPYRLALVSSAAWNLIISAMLIPILWGSGYLEDALEFIGSIMGALSWLVAGAIGFYFSKKE